MFNSLSGRFFLLTAVFLLLAEVLIFVPSIARFRSDFLMARVERAQIASLVLLADDMISTELERELLLNAGVYNVVLRRDLSRQLALASELPAPVSQTFDLRQPAWTVLVRDAFRRLSKPEFEVVRVIGDPKLKAGSLIEVTLNTGPLRDAMWAFSQRILILSALLSVAAALLLFVATRFMIVTPIRRVIAQIENYQTAPEEAQRIIELKAGIVELRAAELALQSMQKNLTSALNHKERLAQLGEAVAKVSHDLRNILTTVQLISERLTQSEDPVVMRLAPKLEANVARAVTLAETTLSFGRASEPAPILGQVDLTSLLEDVVETELMAISQLPIEVRFEISENLIIRADREQLHRALSNLVRNARQALADQSQGGAIVLKAWQNPQFWFIDVVDNGPGLPEKAKAHLFKPFQGTATGGGSGLGLTIVQELMRGHGGSAEYLEVNGPGACFRLLLPKLTLDNAE